MAVEEVRIHDNTFVPRPEDDAFSRSSLLRFRMVRPMKYKQSSRVRVSSRIHPNALSCRLRLLAIDYIAKTPEGLISMIHSESRTHSMCFPVFAAH
jgi:hypothetical protein